MAHFRRAIARSPDLAGARMNLAAALQRRATALASKGELPLAAKSLEEAVRLAPDRAPLHYDWGTILNRQNRPAEAAERFAEAVRLNPSYPEAWNNLGAALARRGEMSRAAACFRKALELRPDFAAARQNLSAAAVAVR